METVGQFKIRGFKPQDVFAMSRIIKKMKMKTPSFFVDDVDDNGKPVKRKKTQDEFGAEIVFTLIENLGDAEEEWCAFLGSLIGISAEEFAELEFEQFMDVFQQFKEHKWVNRFLQLASK